MKFGRQILLSVFVCVFIVNQVCSTCFDVHTSKGLVDLENGQYACSKMDVNGNEVDIGSHYIQCHDSRMFIMSCGPNLKWDQRIKNCNWPQSMNCDLPVPKEPKTTTAATTQDNDDNNNNNSTTTAPTTATTESANCTSETCQLPDCYCMGQRPNMSLADTPMFVLLTFDDAVNIATYNRVYRHFLVKNKWALKNPNNCSIRSTFFVSHRYTDYKLVQILYNHGHEIASHSVNHTSHENTYSEVAAEIVGLRDNVVSNTHVPAEAIQGFRSPFLKIYGDVQYEVLSDFNFTYDSSIANVEIQADRAPFWPYTLDFPIPSDRCPNRPCPEESHPGVWEVPMNGWIGDNGYSCAMLDGCSIRNSSFNGTSEDYEKFFWRNFGYFFEEKVPMHMFTHASMFFRKDGAFKALRAFLEELSTRDDVWFVTPSQLIDWMKNPRTNNDLLNDPTWGCQ